MTFTAFIHAEHTTEVACFCVCLNVSILTPESSSCFVEVNRQVIVKNDSDSRDKRAFDAVKWNYIFPLQHSHLSNTAYKRPEAIDQLEPYKAQCSLQHKNF